MKDTIFARERSILCKKGENKRTYVVHYTSKPESFADTFVVRDNDPKYGFDGLCVYLLDDVTRSSSVRAVADTIWPGCAALIIEVASDDVRLLQDAPLDDSLDEYVIRAGAAARVLKEIASFDTWRQ